jgi:hypothetical protein
LKKEGPALGGEARESLLLRKIRGCLYGVAIGDAMGAPAEWKMPPQIRERYGEIVDFVEPWDGPSEIGKGDGRFTDDTHMTRVLGEIYVSEGTHLDPFRFAERVVPKIADEPRWLAERGQEMLLVDRLFYPEKWLLMRLRLANAIPGWGASATWSTAVRRCTPRRLGSSTPAILAMPIARPSRSSARTSGVMAWKRRR